VCTLRTYGTALTPRTASKVGVGSGGNLLWGPLRNLLRFFQSPIQFRLTTATKLVSQGTKTMMVPMSTSPPPHRSVPVSQRTRKSSLVMALILTSPPPRCSEPAAPMALGRPPQPLRHAGQSHRGPMAPDAPTSPPSTTICPPCCSGHAGP